MKNGAYIIIIFLVMAEVALIRINTSLRREATRQENNYNAALSGVRKYYRGRVAMYEAKPEVLTRSEAKELFKAEFDRLESELKLRKVSQITTVKASAEYKPVIISRDTAINDTIKARTWEFRAPSIQIKALEIGEDRKLEIRQNIDLTITRSLEPRHGIINKIFLRPFTRNPLYTVIPSDTAVKIDSFRVIEIK